MARKVLVVKPTVQEWAVQEELLSGRDHEVALFNVNCCLLFEGLLDQELLRRALERTLDEIPVASGRLNSTRENELFVDQFGAGMEMHVIEFEKEVDPKDVPSVEWTELEWSKHPELFPVPKWTLPEPTEPLVEVHLSLFREANRSVISLKWAHALGDANSRFLFFEAWSDYCGQLRGKPPTREYRVTAPGHRIRTYAESMNQWKTLEDLRNGWVDDEFCPLGGTVSEPVIQKAVELQVNIEDVRTIKEKVSVHLTDGSYLSSMDVFLAMLMIVHAKTTGIGAENDVNIQMALNLRGSGYGQPHDLGNLVNFPNEKWNMKKIFKLDEGTTTSLLLRTAIWVNQVRKSVTKTPQREMDWLNRALALGFGRKLTNTIIEEISQGRTVGMNNIGGFPWFSLTFGSEEFKCCGYAEGRVQRYPNYFRIFARTEKRFVCKIALEDEAKVDEMQQILRDMKFPITLVKQF